MKNKFEMSKKTKESTTRNRNDAASPKTAKMTKVVKSEERYKESVKTNESAREDIIEGRNAVIETLRGSTTVEYILVAKGDTAGSISVVMALAKEKGVVVKEVDRKKLDQMSVTGSHQGVIAVVTPFKYSEVQDILDYASEKGEAPFIVVLDEIEDPHNFGSIIRTAEVCGAHGIIIPKRRNVGVTPVVYKSSAGAAAYMKIAKVTNINTVLDDLKNKGVWIYGADMTGKSYSFDVSFSGACAIVVGSEGKGISKLTKDKCDVLVQIPMAGKVTSLNASVAGGILMYEVLKQKIQRGRK